MFNFITIILNGLKRLFCNKKYLVILIILILISLYSVSKSTSEYKNRMAEMDEFQKLEASSFSKIPDYDKYSDIGARVFFIPGASSIFYQISPAISELYGKVNSIIALNINNNAKTPIQLKANFPIQLSFSFIVLLIGSLSALYLGCCTMYYREFLKYMSSTCSSAKIYFAEVLSRLIFLTISYLLILGINLSFVLIKGVSLTAIDKSGLCRNFLVTITMLLFFFFAGTIIGIFTRSKWKSRTAILTTWIVLVFFIPLIINSISDKRSDDLTSTYALDNQKLGILSDFEREGLNKYGKVDRNRIDIFSKAAEGYFNNEFVQIMGLETELRDELFKFVKNQEKLSVLTPVTFYLKTCSEASSYGNRSFIAMYDYLIELQLKFVRFWINRVYYNDPKIMVNFVKGDENIFRSKSRAPGNFNNGVFISIGYILILAVISYLAFLKSMYVIKSNELSQLGTVDLEMKDGEFYAWLVKENNFRNLLYNLFSGNFKKVKQKGFTGKVVVNGVDIAAEKSKEDFLYICRPEHIPGDLSVKNFINFYAGMLKIPGKMRKEIIESPRVKPLAKKSLDKLSNSERFNVLLSILRFEKKQVYFINDIATGLPVVECAVALKKRMDELKEKGSLVIYLSSTRKPDSKPVEMDYYFYEGKCWEYMVCEYELRVKDEDIK